MLFRSLEDEITLAHEVEALLTEAGHTVAHFVDGHQMMRGLLKDTFDMFVLDWHVPGPNGMEVLQHHTFRVTRNEDLEVEEDDAENLLLARGSRFRLDAEAKPLRPPHGGARPVIAETVRGRGFPAQCAEHDVADLGAVFGAGEAVRQHPRLHSVSRGLAHPSAACTTPP